MHLKNYMKNAVLNTLLKSIRSFFSPPDRKLAVTELDALQCQDKTALKKTFQRRWEQRSTGTKKNKERTKVSHITWGGRTEKKVSLSGEDFIRSAAEQPVPTEKKGCKGEERQLSESLKLHAWKKGHGRNWDISWWRKQRDKPCEENAERFLNVGAN